MGLVPAAGEGRRLAPLPCSKELLPVGTWSPPGAAGPRPRPVCLELLERMARAGARRTFVVLRYGKWDIANYLGDGHALGTRLAYLPVDRTPGVPFTVARALPFIDDARVLFGFPDLVGLPPGTFARLLDRARDADAAIALATFPADDPRTTDIVRADRGGRVREVRCRPRDVQSGRTWMAAAWDVRFTAFLADWVERHRPAGPEGGEPGAARPGGREPRMGDAIQAGLSEGLEAVAVAFDGPAPLDAGTPEGYRAAVERAATAPEYPASINRADNCP